MNKDVDYLLYTAEEIRQRVAELGKQITEDYAGKEPLFVGILKGSFVFMADLVRAVDLPSEVDFMQVSSYGSGTTTTGAVKIIQDLSKSIEGKDLIIVEDILDTGVTLSYLTQFLNDRKPASIRIVALLDKVDRRTADIKADYAGFVIPDAFVVGYGLDYDQKYRCLPDIGVLKPEIYS